MNTTNNAARITSTARRAAKQIATLRASGKLNEARDVEIEAIKTIEWLKTGTHISTETARGRCR